jgi:hypothetical protein
MAATGRDSAFARDNTGTKLQMSQIARSVQMEYVDQNALILGDLTKLIVDQLAAEGRQVTAESGKDIWGNPYWSVAAKGGFCVVSAGPDRKWRTRDDIVFHQSLTALGYRDPPAAAARPALKGAPTATPRVAPRTAVAKPVRRAPPGRRE